MRSCPWSDRPSYRCAGLPGSMAAVWPYIMQGLATYGLYTNALSAGSMAIEQLVHPFLLKPLAMQSPKNSLHHEVFGAWDCPKSHTRTQRYKQTDQEAIASLHRPRKAVVYAHNPRKPAGYPFPEIQLEPKTQRTGKSRTELCHIQFKNPDSFRKSRTEHPESRTKIPKI